LGGLERRIGRLEARLDTSFADHDAEARRRERVSAKLREFEAIRRSMTKEEAEEWRQSPEAQELRRKLEEAIQRKRRGQGHWRGSGA
jgi:hypothetical protein